jgi:hypothetical protein
VALSKNPAAERAPFKVQKFKVKKARTKPQTLKFERNGRGTLQSESRAIQFRLSEETKLQPGFRSCDGQEARRATLP